MPKRVAKARADVEARFQEALKTVDSSAARTLGELEGELWTRLLALGRAMVTLFLVHQAQRPWSSRYEHDGQQYVIDERGRTSDVGTRFGKVSFWRPIGRVVGRCRAKADLPVDRELGLCAGFSLGTVTSMVRLCAMLPFATSMGVFRAFSEWSPSIRATLRMVDGLGAHARPFLEQAEAPEDDGAILVIEVDGRGAPMMRETEHERRRQPRPRAKQKKLKRHQIREKRKKAARPRRKKGDKSKNSKLAIVGVLYTLKKTPQGLEGPINKRIYATFESHEALMRRLLCEARKRGYGKKGKTVVFLADGCDHIWRWQQQLFPDAIPCVDWYHVAEKLYSAGLTMHREGSAELSAWVDKQKERLASGQVWDVVDDLSAVLAAVPKTGPGTKSKRKTLFDVIRYLGDHSDRLMYDKLRARDLPIGSGAVEGAVRNLIAVRFDGPGMRWGRERSEVLLQLRCIVLNGMWEDFVTYLRQRGRITLPAEPIAASAYTAKPQTLQEAA